MKSKLREVSVIFKIDLKKNFNKVSLISLVIFILLSIVILQLSIWNYSDLEKKKDKFLEVEKRKIERYVNYDQYGYNGIKLFVELSPLFSFFENDFFIELEAYIDYSIKVEINNPLKDANIFNNPTGDSLDISRFIAIFFSGLIIAWCLITLRNTGGYLKFLLNFAGPRSVFFGVVLSRAFLILLVLVSDLIISICIYLINGINIFPEISKLLTFLFMTYILMIFFLLLGFFLSTMKSTAKAVITSVVLWLIIVLLWPGVLNTVFSKKARADIESRYQHQMRKLEILTKFEKLINEKSKAAKTRQEMIEINRNLTEKYWNEGFKQIEDLETNMIDDIRKNAQEFQWLSILNPITFYKSVNNELSSMGYNEYLRFYRYSLEKFKGFVRYYFDNRLYKNNPKVVSYLKDDEFIFKARSSLPKYFGAGVLFNIFIIFVLSWISYFRFMRVIFPLPKNARAFKNVDLKLLKGKHLVYSCESKDHEFPAQLYNALMGRKKFPGKISIDGEDIVAGEKQDFFYLPLPDAVPGNIKNKAILALFAGCLGLSKKEKETLSEELAHIINKRFEEIKNAEKIEILTKLAVLKKHKIYLLDNLFHYIPTHEGKEICKKYLDILKGKDTLIIEIASLSAPKHSFFYLYSSFNLDQNSIYREYILGDRR